MDSAVKDLLADNRLDHHAEKLLKFGVQRLEDLAELFESDLEGFTLVEKRRFMRIARHPSDASTRAAERDSESVASDSTQSWLSSVSQSGDATVIFPPRADRPTLFGAMRDQTSEHSAEDSGITVRYCTMQLYTDRHTLCYYNYMSWHVAMIASSICLFCCM